jgi:hypothetical protein
MEESDRKLVIESWAMVKVIGAEIVGVLFFRNIFSTAPQVLQVRYLNTYIVCMYSYRNDLYYIVCSCFHLKMKKIFILQKL